MNAPQRPFSFEEFEIGDIRWERCSLAPTVDDGSSVSDLTGPGRSLDRLYGAIGRHIETQFGRLAKVLGKGPQMTAIRIERRRLKMVALPSEDRQIKNRQKKIEKDCKRLAEYVRSTTPSTQARALDQITRLSRNDEFIREILLNLRAHLSIEQLRRSYLSEMTPILLPRSRKALYALKDTEVNVIVKDLKAQIGSTYHMHNWRCPTANRNKFERLSRFEKLLSDPDRAWLVVRHINDFLTEMHTKCTQCSAGLFYEITGFCGNPSRDIEWSTLERILGVYFLSALDESFSPGCRSSYNPNFWPFLLEFIIQNAERLPRIVDADLFEWFSALDSTDCGIDLAHAYLTYQLLLGIRVANQIAQDKNTILDYATLKKLYPHPSVQSLLRRITYPPEVSLGRFVAKRHQFERRARIHLTPYTRLLVLDTYELARVCEEMAMYLDSGDDVIRKRALHAFEYLLSTDVYSRETALLYLRRTAYIFNNDANTLVRKTERKYNQRPPSLDTTYYLHGYDDDNCTPASCTHSNTGERWDSIIHKDLRIPEDELMQLLIPRGTAFHTEGVHAIPAGPTSSGKQTYHAQADGFPGIISDLSITEGTKPEDIGSLWRDLGPGTRGRKPAAATYLAPYILRYGLEEYGARLSNQEELLSTGAVHSFTLLSRSIGIWYLNI